VEASAALFPYPIQKRTLENGLDVLVVETPEFDDVASVNLLVLAGSRNETEAGKTGLAHLFEHILFRHRYGGEKGGYGREVDALGAHNNAWTWFDVTFYHPLTFSENFERLLELEADRFLNLDFTEKTFKTEAGAVLGEYRNNASFPTTKLSERMFPLLFPDHPYGHTTIGTYEDVLDMPNEFSAAKKFYDDYYRPNNCVLVVVGDLRAEAVFDAAERRFGSWKPGPVPKVPPAAAEPRGGTRERVVWDSDVAPIVWVSNGTPRFEPGTKQAAVAELLGELLVSPAAPLYRRLRYEKKSVSRLRLADGTNGVKSFDPRALTVSAKLYKDRYRSEGDAYLREVEADIAAGLDSLSRFSSGPDSVERLDRLKSRFRYDFLGYLSSPGAIASTLAQYYRFDRDPRVFERVENALLALEPSDVDAFAARWLGSGNRVIAVLVPPTSGGDR
jgi:zinc protease